MAELKPIAYIVSVRGQINTRPAPIVSDIALYATAREQAFEDIERDLRIKVRAMKRAQKQFAKRVDSAMRAYDEIAAVLPTFERQLKRIEKERIATAKCRRGL